MPFRPRAVSCQHGSGHLPANAQALPSAVVIASATSSGIGPLRTSHRGIEQGADWDWDCPKPGAQLVVLESMQAKGVPPP